MKSLHALSLIGTATISFTLSQTALAGRYDGIAPIFNHAAKRLDGISDAFNGAASGHNISGSFNRASGSSTLPPKGYLTDEFNKAANPPKSYSTPAPRLVPLGTPPNSPGF